ncbi:hypothetical protein AKJ16_DCAP10946 [Drosera capensis]
MPELLWIIITELALNSSLRGQRILKGNHTKQGLNRKMSSRWSKSPGWAAFDLQQKQKNQIAEPQSHREPYPLLPTTVPSLEPPQRYTQTQLKMRYNWADDDLIKDILAAVRDDFEKVSSSLEAMVTTGSKEEFEDAYLADRNEPEEKLESRQHRALSQRDLFDSELHEETKFMLGSSTYAPVEPEWEEHDVYLSHRKNAIKLTRYRFNETRPGVIMVRPKSRRGG